MAIYWSGFLALRLVGGAWVHYFETPAKITEINASAVKAYDAFSLLD